MAPQDLFRLETARTVSRFAVRADVPAILAFHRENEAHFAPWDPDKPAGFNTATYWEDRIRDAAEEYRSAKSLRLNVHLRATGELIGMTNFTNFERGPFHNCRLGYKIGKRFEGQGLMQEALRSSITYLFEVMNFHRIEANFIPSNERSGALLERLGFKFHGRAEDYLRIAGKWQDHILTSLINKHWKPGAH